MKGLYLLALAAAAATPALADGVVIGRSQIPGPPCITSCQPPPPGAPVQCNTVCPSVDEGQQPRQMAEPVPLPRQRRMSEPQERQPAPPIIPRMVHKDEAPRTTRHYGAPMTARRIARCDVIMLSGGNSLLVNHCVPK
jgi:hypothetical protein